MAQTKKYLEKLGIEVKIFNKNKDKITNYDIYHLFGSNSVEHLNLINYVKEKGIPIVLSPVYWNTFEKDLNEARNFLPKLSVLIREFQKNSEKILKYNIPLINPTNFYLNKANLIFPNSELESSHLSNTFHFDRNKLTVIYNGVEKCYLNGDEDIFINQHNLSDFILFVGRIEPKKNVLSLIKAVNGTEYKLVLIGNGSSNLDYYKLCKKNANNNVKFLGVLPHDSEMLKSAYSAAKCFVLPSWLETPSISALEAGIAGCNLVITDRGSTKEYFKDMVYYCNPKDIETIKNGIDLAMNSDKQTNLSKHISKNFTWESIAKNVLNGYKKTLTSF